MGTTVRTCTSTRDSPRTARPKWKPASGHCRGFRQRQDDARRRTISATIGLKGSRSGDSGPVQPGREQAAFAFPRHRWRLPSASPFARLRRSAPIPCLSCGPTVSPSAALRETRRSGSRVPSAARSRPTRQRERPAHALSVLPPSSSARRCRDRPVALPRFAQSGSPVAPTTCAPPSTGSITLRSRRRFARLMRRTAGPTHRSRQSVLAGPERLSGGAFPGRILVSDHRDHRGERDQRP